MTDITNIPDIENLSFENLTKYVEELNANPDLLNQTNKPKLLILARQIHTMGLTTLEAINKTKYQIHTNLILYLKKYQLFDKLKYLPIKNSDPRLIMLCGLPCSGKTTFANELMLSYFKSNICNFIHINADELGYSESVRLFNSNAKSNIIILDMCNHIQTKRTEWINDYKSLTSNEIICIYWSNDKSLCINRLESRENHDMTNPNVIKEMSLKYKYPSLEENIDKIFEYQINNLPIIYEHLHIKAPQRTNQIIKFPRTRHLLNLGSASRDDLVYTKLEIQTLFGLKQNLIIEEKIDGANLGISINSLDQIQIQNRSHYVNSAYHAQFELLDKWVKIHENEIRQIIGANNWILYGEWVYMTHAITYTKLPDYFILFDIYDVDINKFLSRQRVEELISSTSICLIRQIAHGTFTLDQLTDFAYSESAYMDGQLEGIYIRTMSVDNEYLSNRAKIVRSDFISGNQHWSKAQYQINQLINQLTI